MEKTPIKPRTSAIAVSSLILIIVASINKTSSQIPVFMNEAIVYTLRFFIIKQKLKSDFLITVQYLSFPVLVPVSAAQGGFEYLILHEKEDRKDWLHFHTF